MFSRDELLVALARHVGKQNGRRADFLVMEILGTNQRDIAGERRLRQLVAELRAEGHHICAHPVTGYFMAANEQELLETCEYLHGRAMCSLRQVAAMRRVSEPDLRGQLRLPT